MAGKPAGARFTTGRRFSSGSGVERMNQGRRGEPGDLQQGANFLQEAPQGPDAGGTQGAMVSTVISVSPTASLSTTDAKIVRQSRHRRCRPRASDPRSRESITRTRSDPQDGQMPGAFTARLSYENGSSSWAAVAVDGYANGSPPCNAVYRTPRPPAIAAAGMSTRPNVSASASARSGDRPSRFLI